MTAITTDPENSWLGPVPTRWSLRRLGTLGNFTKGSGGSKADNRDSGIPVVRYGDLYTRFDTTIEAPAAYVDEEVAAGYTPLPTGALVFTASGEDPDDIGKAAVSLLPQPAVVGGDTILMHVNDEADALFLAYVLQATPLRAHKAVRATGFTVVHISASRLKNLPIPTPPLTEQQAIADYLERETAQIDELIAKQMTLVERLKERRKLEISRAFGEGAARDVTRSDGISSLDDQLSPLPQGWERVRLSRLVASPITAGVDYSAAPLAADHLRYLRTTDIDDITALAHEDKAVGITQEQAGSALVRRNDLLLTRSGSLGTSYLHLSDELMAYAGYLVRVRPDERRCDPRFLAWWTLSDDHLDQIALGATRSTIDNFSASKFAAMRVPVPPLSEQHEIAARLDRETTKIDNLIDKTERFIELTKERRAALITAAVTGQVDVRGKGVA